MSWKCPECGSTVSSESTQCVCGYREIEEYGQESIEAEGREQENVIRVLMQPKAKSVIRKAILVFVVFNLLTYGSFIARQTAGRPYFLGTALMSGALLTSILYVSPLSTILGPNNFVAAPFNGLKNALIYLGRKNFPDNDAEGDLHTYIIAKYEWDNFYGTKFQKISKGKGQSRSSINKLMLLSDELYSLLEPLATKPLKNEDLRRRRLFHFLTAADRYIWLRSRILEIDALARKRNEKQSIANHPFVSSSEEIQRVEQIMRWYVDLKEFCQENEKIACELLESKSDPAWFFESKLIYDATLWINGRRILTNKLRCTDSEIDFFLSSRETILEDVITSPSVPASHRQVIINNVQKSSNKNIYKFVFNTLQKECFEE